MIISLSDIPEDQRTGCPPSVLSCTAWGFSCRANHSARGELLPRLFTLAGGKLTASPTVSCQRTGGVFSVTLSVGARFREGRLGVLPSMLPCGVRTFLWRTETAHQRSSAIGRQPTTIRPTCEQLVPTAAGPARLASGRGTVRSRRGRGRAPASCNCTRRPDPAAPELMPAAAAALASSQRRRIFQELAARIRYAFAAEKQCQARSQARR